MSGRVQEYVLDVFQREARAQVYASGKRYYYDADGQGIAAIMARRPGDQSASGVPVPDPMPMAVLVLVNEVRRLRGLIASATDPAQSFQTILSQARALWAEAEAIRAEQEQDKPLT